MKRYEPRGAFGPPNARARIALSVLAIVAVLGVGVAVGRATASRAAAPASAGPSAAAQPSVQPHGQPPLAASATGPRSIVDGVPVGYAHTNAGAVAAVTNFIEVIGGPLVAHPTDYRAAMRQVMVPTATQVGLDGAEKTMADSEKNYGLLSAAAAGTPYVNQTYPLSYQVVRYSDDIATITIWALHAVAVQGKQPARAAAQAADVSVVWTGGDWRLMPGGGLNVTASGFFPGAASDTPTWIGTDIPGAMMPTFTQYGASPNG